MAAATTFPLMTVEQFDALPEPRGNFTYELHFGRLVKVGRARKTHFSLQCSIRDLLKKEVRADKWFTEIEIAYNLVDGYDARAADVAVVSLERYDKVPGDGYLTVSPELVVFVKSRSNRDTQIEKDAIECLTHGAEAAWYVKYNPDVVYVYTARGKKAYRLGQSIPLPVSMSGRIKVRDIFKNLPR
jgi:Uma2 family endonuclease